MALKRFFAMIIALCICLSAMPLQTLAAEETTTETGTETSPEGLETNITTTTTTTTDDNGNTTVTVTIEKTTEGTTEDGINVSREESSSTTTATDADGDKTGEHWVEEGTETKEWTVEDSSAQPDVTVNLVPGETTTGSATTTTVTGDVQKGEDDTEYDYTETTTTERTVEAAASEGETKTEVSGTSEMNGLKQDTSIFDGNMDAEQLLEAWTYKDAFDDVADTAAPEGYDYQFTTLGQMSQFYAGTISEAGKTGTTGALQLIVEYDPDHVPDGKDDIPASIEEITAAEDLYITYCCDITTDAKDNFWYRLDSLEDAGYYDEEAASYIRAIALNGYWGTSCEPDENGEYQTGSLAKIKADMKAALAAGTISGITEEEIDAITQGQALNATQGAIWKFANSTTGGSNIDEDRLVVKGNKGDVPTEQDSKLAKAVFDYLMSLAPIGKEQATEIIDQDAYIKEDSMSITVGGKVDGAEANADDDNDNDIYNVSLNFALVVTPSSENDDLVVQVISGFDVDGKPIVVAQGRIAGGNAEEDAKNGFNHVAYDADSGVYTLRDLELAENSDFNFDLKLVGTQYLEQGVYIFTSEDRGTDKNGNGVLDENEKFTSQTFVTVVEGSKEVNVSKGFVINFAVDESNTVVSKHVWHNEGDPSTEHVTPEEPEHVTAEAPRSRQIFRLTNQTGVEEIPDEEVPLAIAPKTGDMTSLIVIITMMAAVCLVIMTISDKKRRA